MPGDHALLSPSAAKRWLACSPSAIFERRFEEKASVYADEGTLAHSLAELEMLRRLDRICEGEHDERLARLLANELWQHEMDGYVEDYCDFIEAQYNEALGRNADAQIYTEYKADLTAYIPEGFGTIDITIIADRVLTIIDLKYGKGVPVFAQDNEQTMIYALGALEKYGMLFDIDAVRMIIYQPRIHNINEHTISVAELNTWASEVLIPGAQAAFNNDGDFIAGDHCRWCNAKAVCDAFAKYNLEIFREEVDDVNVLPDSEIAFILSRADTFTKWLAAVEEYALDQAINHGKEWPGYKLVEGRSNRIYSDKLKVAAALDMLYGEEIYEPRKLLGITAMQGLLGKKSFDTLLGKLTIKPKGKPTLVPLADKRPALNSAEDAARDFAEADAADFSEFLD